MQPNPKWDSVAESSDIDTKLDNLQLKLDDSEDIDLSEKYSELYSLFKLVDGFKPQLYNIWNFSRNNNETKHFGNVPTEITENLLYAYTEPFDVVFDPLAYSYIGHFAYVGIYGCSKIKL